MPAFEFPETQKLVVRGTGAKLEFYAIPGGLSLRVLAFAPNRLEVNGVPVETMVLVRLVGPAAGAFWQTLQPAGRPARSVEGLTLVYEPGGQVLLFLFQSRRNNIVTLNGRELARLELRLIGPVARELWNALQ